MSPTGAVELRPLRGSGSRRPAQPGSGAPHPEPGRAGRVRSGSDIDLMAGPGPARHRR
ncbi:MAG: hypothetical protein M3066_12710 [Actinomycetota bacterium]|nr:hypothetical protein [Actinomycetota bacterium]